MLTEKDLPKGGSRYDFRDPKIWRKKDGTYRCIVGNRPEDGSGQILMYESADGLEWKFEKVLISGNWKRFEVSGSRRAIIHQRRCKVNSENGELKPRLILDRFSVEVFINDGEQVMTATMYTDLLADRK